MNGKKIAKYLQQELLNMGFIVHRYNAYSTSSIYLKLDYGLACGIRIADHLGKKKYHYRFNVIENFKGEKVIVKNGLVCYFFSFDELEDVLVAVQKEKQEKVRKYGIDNYNLYMEKEKKENELFTRVNQIVY